MKLLSVVFMSALTSSFAVAAPPNYRVTEIGTGFMPNPDFIDPFVSVPLLADDGSMTIARGGKLVLWKGGNTSEFTTPDGS